MRAWTAGPDSEPKLMPEMLTTELGRNACRLATRSPEDLGARQDHGVRGVHRRGRGDVGEGAVLEDRVALHRLHVVVRAEADVVVLHLGRGVDPGPLVPAEGPLLVVARDDVLPQLGSDALEQVAGVGDDREVALQGVLLLQQVPGSEPGGAG